MPDVLTPEDRAAIAAYTGPIRVIPRGVSGLPDYAHAVPWADQIKACFDRGKAIKEGMARTAEARRAQKPRMEIFDGEPRSATIARLRDQGRTLREIGDFLRISHVTVHKIILGKMQ